MIGQSTFSEYQQTKRTRGGIEFPGFEHFHRLSGELPQAAAREMRGVATRLVGPRGWAIMDGALASDVILQRGA